METHKGEKNCKNEQRRQSILSALQRISNIEQIELRMSKATSAIHCSIFIIYNSYEIVCAPQTFVHGKKTHTHNICGYIRPANTIDDDPLRSVILEFFRTAVSPDLQSLIS
jgi:hypothetical protein